MRMIYLAKIKITEIEERNRIEDQPERIMMEEEHDPERKRQHEEDTQPKYSRLPSLLAKFDFCKANPSFGRNILKTYG